MKPVNDAVVVIAKDEVISEYIIVKNEDKPQRGIVISVGEKVKDVKDEDEIIFNKHHATIVDVEDQEFLIIRERDIYAKIET